MIGEFDLSTFCGSAADMLRYVGWVILIIKIAIPIIIFAIGIVDLGKAVVAAKEDDTKTAVKRLMWRLIAGIVIFFLPNIVMFLFGTIAEFDSNKDDFKICKTCILSPSSETCKQTDYTK